MYVQKNKNFQWMILTDEATSYPHTCLINLIYIRSWAHMTKLWKQVVWL